MEIIRLEVQTSLWRVNSIPDNVPEDKLGNYKFIDCQGLYDGELQPDHFANGLYFSTLPLIDGENIIEDRVRYLEEGRLGAIVEVRITTPIQCIFYDEIKGEQDVPNMINDIEARLGLRKSYPQVPANFSFIEWLASIHYVFKDVELVENGANIYEIIFPHRLLFPRQLFRQISHGIWRRNYRGMQGDEFIKILD